MARYNKIPITCPELEAALAVPKPHCQPKATQLSSEMRQILAQMLSSGESEQVYVAEALDEIASNAECEEGSDQATDTFLLQSCEQIKTAIGELEHLMFLVAMAKKPTNPYCQKSRRELAEQGIIIG